MKAIACVVLMIGLLKFAQDAPDLLKRVFGFGGDLLKGMNLNPKGMLKNDMKSAAKTLAKPGSTAMGAIGGLTGGAVRGFQNGKKDYDDYKSGSKHPKLGKFGHTLASTVGGGARGFVRGGVNGFKTAPDELSASSMYSSMSGGVATGQYGAQKSSSNYRNAQGKFFTRIGNSFGEFGGNVKDGFNEHVGAPVSNMYGQIVGNTTSNQAGQVFSQIKGNNSEAMSATGASKDIENIKTARDNAIQKIREAQAMGTTIGGRNDYDDMIKQAKNQFNEQKAQLLNDKFGKMNDANKKIIAEWNKDSIKEFTDNLNTLGRDDLESLINGLNGKLRDANGATINLDASNISDSLNQIVNTLNQSADYHNLSSTAGAQMLDNMDKLQTEMGKINTSIENSKKREESKKSRKKSASAPASDKKGDK